ncbi:glycerol-3-phosphate 1-O-acyltransferase PlsB [Psychromonas sp.]|uniref:glycerol-3-phosphate 1-O-acyltransferase PlsB n=1 Tax=Psychromonas sp. TaxID=1884585 RepID=UPI003563C2C8
MLTRGSVFHRLINKYWVKSHYVPLRPAVELQLDLSRPIIYVIAQNSASDVLGLQACCLQAGLPDPCASIKVAGQTLTATIFIHGSSLFTRRDNYRQWQDAPYLAKYQQLLDLLRNHPDLDIQLLPVTFYWGRNPGKQGKISRLDLIDQGQVGSLRKTFIVLKNAKDHLIRFNKPISVAALIQRKGKQKNNPDLQLAHNLARVAMRYFGSQKRHSVGPKLPNRSEMITAVLQQPALRKVICATAAEQQLTELQVEQHCRTYLLEISAHFSYPFLRVFRFILKWVWHYIYQGIEVNHAEAVRQVNQSGAEIIYMPCHRSHMDYLLLSYLLFEQGLMPPHVAAGVNLNFFPAGPVFRRCGGFFLRRSFKGAPLYTAVFNAYFSLLFKQGYPIEFFCEAGRSRSGRLLPPKTGLLATSLQTYLNQPERNVVIVPVYIGYDHIMEVSTYVKELSGQKKQQENFSQVVGIIKKLGNFGRAFVNFGEPINIRQSFDQHCPNWQALGVHNDQFKVHVQQVARQVMIAMNAAVAVNALPLCAAILLASESCRCGKALFLTLIGKHQKLLAVKSEHTLLTYAQGESEAIYQQALAMNKFNQDRESVFCSAQQAAQLNYYRNNILHIFALPGLLCHTLRYLLSKNKALTTDNIIYYSGKLYPFLAAEYFLPAEGDITRILKTELQQLQYIGVVKLTQGVYSVSDDLLLTVFARHVRETLLRYRQSLLLLQNSIASWADLDHKAFCHRARLRLQPLGIEPFDEKVLLVFLQTLQTLYPDFVQQQQGKLLAELFYHFAAQAEDE